MSSSSGSGFAHHVFLSRGDDTRWTFSDHLYAALLGSGFRTFRVEERDGSLIDSDLERETLEREIKGSRSSVIVFSRGFVGSKRCLDEMAMILDLMKKRVDSGRVGVVLPVFYDLDPSEVRKQTGVVGEALAKHKGGYEAEGDEREKMNGLGKKMERWKEALREVADLAGLVLQNQADG